MSRGQYPFWKDQQISWASSEATRYRNELARLKEKMKHIKCPKCGHTFEIK